MIRQTWMKVAFASFAFAALAGCSEVSIEPLPVVFVNGQSNATAREEPSASAYNGADLLTWDGSAWVEARAELPGNVGRGIGSWSGRVLRRAIERSGDGTAYVQNLGWPDRALDYFLPNAKDVALASGDPDPEGRNNFALARARWTESGKEPTVLVWSQGEADGEADADTYEAALTELANAWWSAYPALRRIVIVRTAEGACGRDTTAVRTAQEHLVATDPRVVLLDLDDLTPLPKYFTGCHYTRLGYERFGDRLYWLLD